MDSSRTAGTPDSRLLLPVSRQSLWNPAVSSAKHQPAPDQRSVSSAPPPAAHQSVPGHLSRLHVNQPHLPPPPPAHRPDPPRGYRPGQSFAAPPHIYSTIGAFPAANGHVSSKSNFTNVDSLISKSCPVSLTESRSRPLSSKAEPELQPSVSAAPPLSGHWTPGKSYAQLPHFPIAIPTTYMQPFHQQQRISPKDQAEKKRSSRGPASYLPQQHHHQHQSAVAEVTFASMMCGQRPAGLSLHHQPVLHPNHFQPMSSQSSPLFSATTTHHPLRTSHPLPPHLLPHHLPIEQLPGHQPVAQSPICDMSRVCDNNNCSPLQSDKQARPESQPPDPDNQNRSRRDVVNENSCEVPCSSVSPTNSTTSSSNSGGGGSKFLPKKMWMQKYTYTNQDCPSGGPALLPDKSSPDDLVRENGLIHSNDNSSSSSTSNSQQQHNSSSSGNMNCAASSSNNHIIAASKSKEKVNGASKKKPVPGTKRLKVEAVAADSEATASGSESEAGEKGRRKAGNRGQKRCGQAAGKRAKKVKGDEAAGKTADDATGVASHERDTGDKSADSGKKSWKQSQQVNEDSERTEDEDDEQKQEDFDKAEAAAVSSASCEPAAAAACKQKRGRKPKTASASSPAGKRSPSSSISSIASSNSVSKKEKSPKSKGSDKNKKCKSVSSCDSIDKSGQPFLQNKSCSELSPKSSALLPKCRECKMTPYQKIKKEVGPSIFCRFYQFRKLVFDKELKAAGFSEPKDALDEDFKLWLPPERGHDQLTPEAARFLIDFVGDHFCTLVTQEAKALSLHMGSTSRMAWKSVVAGVREMCDVCETTLFNIHWVCSDCGFVVCIDCYRTRRDEESVQAKENRSKQQTNSKTCSNGQNIKTEKCNSDIPETQSGAPSASSPPHPVPPPTGRNHSRDRDRFDWLYCNNKQPHLQDKLILTQIISKTALWDVCKRLHEVKRSWNCPCSCDNDSVVAQVLKKARTSSENKSLKEKDLNGCSDLQQVVKSEAGEAASAASPLTVLADVAINSSDTKAELDQVITSIKKEEAENGDEESADKSASALRDLLSNGSPTKHVSESGKGKVSSDQQQQQQQPQQQQPAPGVQKEADGTPVSPKKRGRKAPPILSTQLNGVLRNSEAERPEQSLQYFSRRINPIFTSKNTAPRVSSLEETRKQFPDIGHDWWCDGRLLVLKDTGNETPHMHLRLFEQQWLRHQPVVVCKVHEWLERRFWQPSVFKNKFSEARFDLVDTESREVVRDQPLKTYWDGFENMKLRARDKDNRTVIYKLKDWPPGEEFGEALPEQFSDLMSCIPMPDYTTDSGPRNLVGRLPRSFGLIPDLGPKMYTAYGLASDEKGTTNLHLDMSDAVNVMVYVGTFKCKPDEVEHQKNVLKALEEAHVEKNQMERLTKQKEKVGALWHIYDARDADKIRDMLNCYALEQGKKLHPHHDPIHDQSFYLDVKLRKRLKDRYSVVGYAIIQFYGDAVFIPAGAPHQVRNLSSCIKVAEDFVSPENVAHCFNLTEEFRQLSQAHDNHEDKLQIKNIIYHTIKDSLAAFADVPG